MPSPTDLDSVSASLFIWHHYDRSIKAELYSTAVETTSGLFFVDPISIEREILEQSLANRTVAGVVITNVNHCRAAIEQAGTFEVPVFAHATSCATCGLPQAQITEDGEQLADDLCVVAIEGAPGGEIALHHDRDGGAIIVGDALINFEPYGFAFLPAKYCSNSKQMRRSLRRLLDFDFERMLFAHGMPLLLSARKRLEQLLDSGG